MISTGQIIAMALILHGIQSARSSAAHADCKTPVNMLDDSTRWSKGANLYCDKSGRSGTSPDWKGDHIWYRFPDGFGLAASIPKDYANYNPNKLCSTQCQGYLTGKLPSKEDGLVVRKVCFAWLSSCWRHTNITVLNCGTHFRYKLPSTPGCHFRYCGAASEDINECLSSPCRNGGVCQNLMGDYACKCAAEWTGKDCDQDADECKLGSHDCDANAICTNTPGNFVCLCKPGYDGRKGNCQGKYDIPSDRITCPKDGGIKLELEPTDLPDYIDRTHLSLGACNLKSDGTLHATKACGLSVELVNRSVLYTGNLHGLSEVGNITRRLPVSMNISCSYCCLPSSVNVDTDIKITFDLHVGEVRQTGTLVANKMNWVIIKLFHENGKEINGSVNINQNVTARVEGPRGMRVAPGDCWISDSKLGIDSNVSHTLIKDSCLEDHTVTMMRSSEEMFEIRFRTFAFNKNPSTKLYLHCKIDTCKSNEHCGTCKV